jgi:hypothetical protein
MMDRRSLDKVFSIKFSTKISERQAHPFKVGLLLSNDGIERPCRAKIRLLGANDCPIKKGALVLDEQFAEMHFAD